MKKTAGSLRHPLQATHATFNHSLQHLLKYSSPAPFKSRIRVVKTGDKEFFSFRLRKAGLRWSQEAYEKSRYRVRELTGPNWGVSMAYRLHRLAQ